MFLFCFSYTTHAALLSIGYFYYIPWTCLILTNTNPQLPCNPCCSCRTQTILILCSNHCRTKKKKRIKNRLHQKHDDKMHSLNKKKLVLFSRKLLSFSLARASLYVCFTFRNLLQQTVQQQQQQPTRRPRQNGVKNKLQQITMSSYELEKTIQHLDVPIICFCIKLL